ncbi:MAG: hypothetical protein Q9165_001268 [Trypethelium subeluteriae]
MQYFTIAAALLAAVTSAAPTIKRDDVYRYVGLSFHSLGANGEVVSQSVAVQLYTLTDLDNVSAYEIVFDGSYDNVDIDSVECLAYEDANGLYIASGDETPFSKSKSAELTSTRHSLAVGSVNCYVANAVEEENIEENGSSIASTYLCGNSLGLQPRLTSTYLSQYLSTWATKGVYGHFKSITDSPLLPWLHVDDAVTSGMSNIVGAHVNEVAVMQTLTANLHLLLATFYRPTPYRHKIIIESKAFPSDHYAIESHLRHHHHDPAESMICIEPPVGTSLIPTSHILDTIRQHADTTALVLLPGIQFYTGQYLDIQTITREVHAMGLPIGWDLAHAVGNVPLELHAWDVDFAAWCMYKYLNCGPGCGGGLFVHRRHSSVSPPTQLESQPQPQPVSETPASSQPDPHSSSTTSASNSNDASTPTNSNDPAADSTTTPAPTPWLPRTPLEHRQGHLTRLAGWWGSSKPTRFAMSNRFEPIPGAAGWQLSNPSVLDLTSVQASLAVFATTSMAELRAKSVRLTGWLEELLSVREGWVGFVGDVVGGGAELSVEEGRVFGVVTAREPEERGAQLSVLLADGLLDPVMEVLEEEGCVVDERRPNVIRVAPAPMYNTFEDVRRFVVVFEDALKRAVEVRKGIKEKGEVVESLMVHGGEESRGWSEIK